MERLITANTFDVLFMCGNEGGRAKYSYRVNGSNTPETMLKYIGFLARNGQMPLHSSVAGRPVCGHVYSAASLIFCYRQTTVASVIRVQLFIRRGGQPVVSV